MANTRIKKRALLATALAVMLLASACGGGSDGSGAAKGGEEAKDYGTNQPGVLKIAFDSNAAPGSYLKDNQPAGYYVELMKSIADALGQRVDFVALPSGSQIPNIVNHTYDTGTIGALVTPERLEQVNFTTATTYNQSVLISRKDAPLKSFNDANGKTIAATTDAFVSLLATQAPKAEVKKFQDGAGALAALRAKQVDGMVYGVTLAGPIVKDDSTLQMSASVTSGNTAIPIAKDRPKLLEAFNTALKKLADSGRIAELYKQVYGLEIPSEMYKDYPNLKPAK